MRDEKDAKISGGLYHELQVRMTYNSNHIEGSRLTEEQTRMIFETNTIDVGDGVPVDDILETAKPKDVPEKMERLLEEYNRKVSVKVEDIIAFHAEFEYIHPFQDGNGRVGRLIALKECLRHNIIPFLIEDTKKNFYYRGLAEWRNETGDLLGTCLDGQDMVTDLLQRLEIPVKKTR